MDEDLNRARVLSRLGLSTEALGPPEEWAPVARSVFQRLHNQFWSTVQDMMPDDDADEPFWMSEAATQQLENN